MLICRGPLNTHSHVAFTIWVGGGVKELSVYCDWANGKSKGRVFVANGRKGRGLVCGGIVGDGLVLCHILGVMVCGMFNCVWGQMGKWCILG